MEELTIDQALPLLRGNSAFRLVFEALRNEYEDKLLELKECAPERLDRLAGEITQCRETLDFLSNNDLYGF